MATRMQQRRGTASQWTSANPVLNAGEMGWESDTNKFKIGDGTNHWADLDYFADTNSTVNPSFGTSIIFEGATADSYETTLQVTDPTADRTITFPDATGTVALTTDIAELSQDAIDAALTAGTGITKTYNDGANTLTLAVDTTTIQARVTDVSDTEIGYLNGVTSAIQTQLDDKSTASKTETLTNKTLTSPVISTIVNSGTLTLPTSTGTIALTTDIPAGVVTESGTQTLTNKTITSPVVSGLILSDSSIVIEGSSANDFETTLTVTDPTADRTITLPDVTGTIVTTGNLSSITSVGTLDSLTVTGDLTINGTTTTINSTTLTVDDKNIVLGDVETPTDTTADGGGITLKGATDKTFNWVDTTDAWTSSEHINLASSKSYYMNGTLLKDVSETLTNKTLTSPIITGLTLNDSSIVFEGSTADEYETTLTITDPTADRTITFPNLTGTVSLLDATETLSNKTLSSATLTGSLTAGGGTGTSGQVLKSTGSGVEWTTPAGGAAFNEFMLIGA